MERLSGLACSTPEDVNTLVVLIKDTSDGDDDDPGDTGQVTVTGLHVYPVKSCAGMRVTR